MFTRWAMVAVLAGAVGLSGCGTEQGNGGDSGAGDGAQTSGYGNEDTGNMLDNAMQQAKDQVSTQWVNQMSSQISQYEDQLANWKQVATQKADEQLTTILEQLETKLAAAQQKISQIKNAEGDKIAALKDEMSNLMSEIKPLIDQASAKIKELSNDAMEQIQGMGG